MDPLTVPDTGTLALLVLVALVAGWVDAVSGGGGMLQLPALLLTMPDAEAVQALGTNKASSIAGTSAAAVTYSRWMRPDLRTALPMAGAALVGSAAGALTASRIPTDLFRPIIVILLTLAWLWALLQPAMGQRDALRWQGRRRHYVVAVVAGGAIGFYDGLLGPGTGSLLMVVLVGVLGYSYLRASATAKFVNLGTNVVALAVFAAMGSVLWVLALLMASANLVGGVIGARMAIRRGSSFVRGVFLVVAGVLILRLTWDLLA